MGNVARPESSHRAATRHFWYNSDTMNKTYTRREFIKLAALSLGSLAFRPFAPQKAGNETGFVVRVAAASVSVYAQPDDTSRIVQQRYRDELVNVYHEIVSDKGPGYNPVWYRVWGGYMHSARLQTVREQLNPVVERIPAGGLLAEVSVPYTQAYMPGPRDTWSEVYRLYCDTLHWVIALDEGPDGGPWYRLKDELNDAEYHVPAEHLRIVRPEEMSPLAVDVPPEKKRIEVSIEKQMMWAYEEDRLVFSTKVSTGVLKRDRSINGIPTATPVGEFRVISKMPSKHMGGGQLTNDLEAYVLPGVPWTTFFDGTGVAFHGTYWHTNYGMTMSRGCVNLRPEEARWVFRWTTPVTEYGEIEKRGYGTRVIVT